MSRSYTPDDILQIVINRRWLILVPLAIGLAVARPAGDQVPERYRSETMIMVVPQRVPDTYVRSTITENVEGRLPSITDQILSRSRLEQIITEFELYPQERATRPMEDVVARMRGRVQVGIVGRSQDSFRVAFEADDPRTAQRVTHRLSSLYIQQNMVDRASQAEKTSHFIETELEDARSKLVESERKLEDYKLRHAGELPTQSAANLQAIQSAELQLQRVSEAMNRARERRYLAERQVADLQAFPVVPVPVVAGAPATTATPAQQLAAARTELEALRLRATPNHPDVVRVQAMVAELEIRVEQEPASDEGPVERVLSPAELVQERRIREAQAEMELIDRQLAEHADEEVRLKRVIRQYEARLDVLPTRESEMVELTRDYDTLQKQYASLLTKREDAQIAANLERQQIGESFRIVDPASLPEKPSNERLRLMLMAAGPLTGLVLGFLLVGLLEYRDTSFRREEDVMRALSLPVLALVPLMAADEERKKQRWWRLAMDLAGTCVLVASVAALVLWPERL